MKLNFGTMMLYRYPALVLISHKAERRPGSGEIRLAVTRHDGVQVDSILPGGKDSAPCLLAVLMPSKAFFHFWLFAERPIAPPDARANSPAKSATSSTLLGRHFAD